MADVEIRRALIELEVRRIQIGAAKGSAGIGVDGVRPAIRRQEREPRGEAALQLEVHGVEIAFTGLRGIQNAVEVRIRIYRRDDVVKISRDHRRVKVITLREPPRLGTDIGAFDEPVCAERLLYRKV